MSSVSPLSLSGYNSSGSRRKRRETGGGGGSSSVRGGGDGSSSVLSSSSPYSLADVPPIFPLSGAPRPRRSAGAGAGAAPGLPPPVPVAHTYSAPSGSTGAAERSARSTWRSLSPSRAGEDRGWSISPVLAARAGNHRNVISPVMMGKGKGKADTDTGGVGVAYTSPSAVARTGGGSLGGDDERRDGGEARARLLPPPHGAPKREAGRTARAADVAKLGRAMGMPSTATPESVRPIGAQTGDNRVCEAKCDDPPKPSAGETVSRASEGGDADGTPSSVATSNQDPYAGLPSRESPVPAEAEVTPSCEPGQFSAAAETSQAHHPSPPTSSARDQGWMTDLSEAALPDAGGLGPAASPSDLLNAGAISDGVARDDNDPRDISAAFGSDGSSSASGSPKRPPTSASNVAGEPAAARTSAVPEALSLGVAAGPSPFVNTSSPLTRSRNKAGQEVSMFGAADDAVDGESEEAGDSRSKVSGGAADLFATEAPARAADELFSSEPGATGAAGSADGPGGSADDTSMFSQGPPPEVPAVPPPSLPTPWGTSPLKQPLAEPKRWPTKGGTGFDRPLTPLAATERVLETGSPRAGQAGAIPSAFFGPASGELGDDGGGFGGAGAGTGGGAGGGGLEGQAFDKPAVAGRPAPGIAPAKPWEGGSSNAGGPSGGGGGVPGEASRTNSSVPPASSKLSSSRFGVAGSFKGFSGRSELGGGAGGAWGGSSALAAAAGMAAVATVPTDCAAREQGVTPAGVIASFGFGGKLVTMHPRRKIKLAPAPGVPPTPDDGSTLRKGPVNVSRVKALIIN